MRDLLRAWNDRNLRTFDASMEAIARFLAGVAADSEPLGLSDEQGPWILQRVSDLRALSRVERDRAMGAMFDRVQSATRRLMDRLIELHQLSGVSQAQVERRLEDAFVPGNEAVNPTTGAIAGGAVSGLITGLGADVLAGGLSLGGGAIIGAMLGALGGYAFGGAYRLAIGGAPQIQFQPAALERLTVHTVLRYLLVAHYGRGRGDYTDVDFPSQWSSEVAAAVDSRRDVLNAVWRDVARDSGLLDSAVERLQIILNELLRELLRHRFPEASVFSDGTRP
jgi:hypothetical protein